MRVTRRIRPSQVGCAASASRRRLYAASGSETPEPVVPRALSRPVLVIDIHGQILTHENSIDLGALRPAYDDAAARAVAKSRG